MLKKNFLYFCVIVCFSIFANGQNKQQNEEPVLVPLTEEQKKINPRDIVLKQPDFTADEVYFSARAVSGFSTASKVARKGKQYRIDTGFVVVITELNKPVIRIQSEKTLEKSVANYKPRVSPTAQLNPTDLLDFDDIAFTSIGTIEVDKNKLLKIEAKSKEFDEEVFLYADLGKKNLITIVQVINPQRGGIQRLQNISFDVPENLFDLSGFKESPKFDWEKVKTAKVFSDGKLVEGAIVFRHQQFLFVHVREFNHMLIDLNEKVADTVVFQGLLVGKKSGAYVWRTNEDEAISIGELSNYIKPNCDDCVKIEADANSVTIPDPDNKKKTLVKINW